MTDLDLRKVADVFAEISGEVILKRRQNLFLSLYNLDNRYKSFLGSLASLSLALNNTLDVLPKATIKNDYSPFSESFGKVLYFLLEEDFRGARRELHKQSSYLQVIFAFVLNKKIITQLTHEFLFNTLDDLEPLAKLLGGFVKIPLEEPKVFLEKVVSFSSSDVIEEPFYLLRRTKLHRTSGKLYYLTNNGGVISSNITNKMVRTYLTKSCTLTKYGVLASVVFNKKKSRVKYVQVLYFSEDLEHIKELYTGKSPKLRVPVLNMMQFFSKAPATIEVTFANPKEVVDIWQLPTTKGYLDNGNIIVHKGGIAVLANKPKTVKAKVIDYLLDEDTYEPLGFLVNTETGTYEVRCVVTNDIIDMGIDDLYINVKQTKFLDEVIKTEFNSILSNKYRTCALCGETERLLTRFLCYSCHTTLFKQAVSHTGSFEFDLIAPAIPGTELIIEKYNIKFLEVSVGFTENLTLIKGKQQRLVYDWWSRENWRWASYKNAK